MIQNGSPMHSFFLLQSNNGPVVNGPIDRARQLNEAEAPFTAARYSGAGTVFVMLS